MSLFKYIHLYKHKIQYDNNNLYIIRYTFAAVELGQWKTAAPQHQWPVVSNGGSSSLVQSTTCDDSRHLTAAVLATDKHASSASRFWTNSCRRTVWHL